MVLEVKLLIGIHIVVKILKYVLFYYSLYVNYIKFNFNTLTI